jgi:glycosyltransferase involved in cell wall biosynthesis
MERVILFEGAYATLDLFTEEIRTELEKRGYETLVFNVNEYQGSLMKLAQFVQKPVKLVLAYNNLGFNMELVPGQNIWDSLGIAFVNILMDHPFHYKNALDKAPKNSYVLCVDRKHVEYIKRFWPEIGNVFFMPHGGAYVENGKPWKERDIDVLYAGGLSIDLTQGLKPKSDSYPEFDTEKLIRSATDRLIRDHRLTTEEVIEEYLTSQGLSYSRERLSQLITDFRIIDSYATSYYREKVIEALVDNGVKVTVYGNGWENRSCMQNKNFIYGGCVKPAEVLELMKNAKIVLNTMTWFKAGSHDRIFHGMMAGAVCMTDYSEYIREVITDGENGYIFELDHLDKLVSDVKNVLGDEKLSERIASAGRETAVKEHTFENRVSFILELLQ